MKFEIVDADRADIIFYFDPDDIPYHSGACDATVHTFYMQNYDEICKIPLESIRAALRVTGGWQAEELEKMGEDELREYIIWIAAGNAVDNGEREDDIDGSGRIVAYVSTY